MRSRLGKSQTRVADEGLIGGQEVPKDHSTANADLREVNESATKIKHSQTGRNIVIQKSRQDNRSPS